MATEKIIRTGSNSQDRIIEGVTKAAEAIKVTMGPSGKCVAISDGMYGDTITRDGVTVAKSISFKDPELNMGAQLLRKAAELSNSQSGDATSTTSILIKEFCIKGKKAVSTGSNVNEIKSGMLKAGQWMTKYIKSKAIPVDGDLEKIRKVATISANNDQEVGDLVVDCMKKVGFDGVITADLASGLDTVVDITTGMKLERGWSSPQYVTSPEDGKCTLENPYIFVVGDRISSVNQIYNALESYQTKGSGRPILIICDDMDENVNFMLIRNTLMGAIRCCVVKGIDFGDARKNIMQDIATVTGGKFVCTENGIETSDATIECFGGAKKVVISRDSTIIFEGYGDPEEIKKRTEIIKKRMESPDLSAYDKTKFEKRIANLCGGIAVIKAGGATEAEKVNRKATIEDSILASKSAISEGCAPGCGYVYFQGATEMMEDKAFLKTLIGDELEGVKIIATSLPVIMKTVIDNCGESSEVIMDALKKSKKDYYGFNAKTKKYCNLVDDGVLDSSKVLRCALENAISTASMILLIDCTLFEEPEEKCCDCK